jgi:hypothetical protein
VCTFSLFFFNYYIWHIFRNFSICVYVLIHSLCEIFIIIIIIIIIIITTTTTLEMTVIS